MKKIKNRKGSEPERIAEIMKSEGIKRRPASAQLIDESLTVDQAGAGRKNPHGVSMTWAVSVARRRRRL